VPLEIKHKGAASDIKEFIIWSRDAWPATRVLAGGHRDAHRTTPGDAVSQRPQHWATDLTLALLGQGSPSKLLNQSPKVVMRTER